jgi:hypothetical protein
MLKYGSNTNNAICIKDLKSLPTKDLKYDMLLDTMQFIPLCGKDLILAIICFFWLADLSFMNWRSIYLQQPNSNV